MHIAVFLDDVGQNRSAVYVHLTWSLETMRNVSHSLRAITTESVVLDKLKYPVSLPLSLAMRAGDMESKIYILHGRCRFDRPNRCAINEDQTGSGIVGVK